MKVVIITGAGATLSEAIDKSLLLRPPVDNGFFEIANKSDKDLCQPILKYFSKHYNTNIIGSSYDSLEGIMTKLFVDSYHSKLSSEATIAYKAFISILNRRIANTTNQIPIKSNGNLYRIILGHLEHGIRPQDITIITFNQDLYIL